jgi:short-subunit dehydrogenase
MKCALITGASSGLGEQFVWLFAKQNIPMVLVARRKDRLNSLAEQVKTKHNVQVFVIEKDLSLPNAVSEIVDSIRDQKIHVEYLVNNAGFGILGRTDNISVADNLNMIDLNVRTLVHLTRALLPQMLENKSGKILNIGSTGGFQPGPYMATYFATKAFVNSFSEALSEELKSTGVTVTLSCPGPTQTEFGGRAGASGVNSAFTAPAHVVATQAFDAMMAGRRRIIHGFGNRVIALLSELSPKCLVLPMVSRLTRAARGG